MDRRHIKTILKNIDKLERELYTNYTSQEIYDAIVELLDKDRYKTFTPNCDLIWNIYSGVQMDLDLDDEYEREDDF